MTMVDFPGELLETLERISPSGTFASSGTVSWPVNPEIYLNGSNGAAITLPLQDLQARQLIEKAHQAPYGKGHETLVDTSVRNTWELNPDQFGLKNPAWSTYVQQICAHVGKELGVNTSFSPELYKMLIYETGAMFKAHTDTEKVPGMFATLVIGLPSAHQGGEVIVRHRGEAKTLKISETQLSYACWYTDIVHEVLPVTSGYRWVLTYNLTIDPSKPRPSAGLQTPEMENLSYILRKWIKWGKGRRGMEHAYYTLDHQYTQASISCKTLKDRDLTCVEALKEVASTLQLDVFLATLEKKESGTCEYEDSYDENEERISPSGFHALQDAIDTQYRINSLVDLDGFQVAEGITLETNNVLQVDPFDEVDPEEDYSGYMGNWGPEATHWYRISAVVLVPRDSTAEFLLESSARDMFAVAKRKPKNVEYIIGYFAKLSLQPYGDKSVFKTIQDLCRAVWSNDKDMEASILPQGVITKVLEAAFRPEEKAFFEEAAGRHRGKLCLDFFDWAREHLAAGVVNFEDFQDSLMCGVLGFPLFWERHTAVTYLAPPYEPISEDVRNWVCTIHDIMLDMIPQQRLSHQDGKALIDIVAYHDGFGYLTSRVVPVVSSKLQESDFALAFLSRLREVITGGTFPTEEGTKLCRQVAKEIIEKLDISTLNNKGSNEQPSTKMPRLSGLSHQPEQDLNAQSRESLVTHEALVEFVTTIIQLDSSDELLTDLSEKILAGASSIHKSAFHSLWLPFLHNFILICKANSIPVNKTQNCVIFTAIMMSYINIYVGKKPSEDPNNFARPTVQCYCGICRRLNDFLRNATQKVGRFSLAKRDRAHVHQNLDSARMDCTHETERFGSPFTLVVTKTFTQIDRARKEWSERRFGAVGQLRAFDRDTLISMLGDNYNNVMGMGLNTANARSILPSSAPVADVVHRKRKAESIEVVDLTGGD